MTANELVLAGLGAQHAERGGECVDVQRAEALVQEKGAQARAGAAAQLDQRESEGQGDARKVSPPDKVLGLPVAPLRRLMIWKSPANPNSPSDSWPSSSLETPRSALVRSSVRYCGNLPEASSARRALTAVSRASLP
jgi:hypothetical protein